MLSRPFVISLVVISATFGSLTAWANSSGLKPFDIKKEPQRSDWQYFHNAPERMRYDLWKSQRGQGYKLGDWAWGWRLGWVKACAKSQKKYCRTILMRALFDDALVVRAESATILGRRYGGTAHTQATKALAKAYRLEENFRNGKPLFVTKRILFALQQIGGDEATKVGPKLAASHAQTVKYWQRISR